MPQELKNTLLHTAESLPSQRDSLYILLDGAQMNAPLFAYSNDDSPVVEPLYLGTRHETAISVSPCLIKPSAQSRLWQQRDQWQSKGVVLRCSEPMPVLKQHLQSLVSIRLPNQQLAYCRYYSPTWLVRLLNSLSAAELSAWSGPVQGWYARASDGWVSAQLETLGVVRKSEEEGWFALKQEQLDLWQAEERERFIDRSAAYLGCETPLSEIGRDQRTAVAALTSEAHKRGFVLEYQCLQYLELAWRFPRELKSPNMTRLLSDQEQGPDQRLELAEQQLFGLNKDV